MPTMTDSEILIDLVGRVAKLERAISTNAPTDYECGKRDGIKQERERCARIATAYKNKYDGEDSAKDTHLVGVCIAEAIRAEAGEE